MGTIHTEHFRIRTSEINPQKLLHPYALIQLMQEASMQHTISMKVSVWDMENMKASWVLLKMEVHFYRLPSLNEEVKVETYPSGLDGYFTYRDYYMYGQDGTQCATISSMWTLMNTETRKMMKIPESFSSLVHLSATTLQRPDFRLKPIKQTENNNALTVNYFHLDWNGHVNNVQLVRLMFERMDYDMVSKIKLKSLKLHFKAEATMNQQLNFCNEKQDNHTVSHAVKDMNTGKDILHAESEWE